MTKKGKKQEPVIKDMKKIQKKMARIKRQIPSIYLKHVMSLSTSTVHAWELGTKLNSLKELCIRLKISWTKYIEDNFSYIHIKKAQRYMRIAKHIDMKSFPALSFIPMETLEEFIVDCKKQKDSPDSILNAFKKFSKVKGSPDNIEVINSFKTLFKILHEGLPIGRTGWRDMSCERDEYHTAMMQDQKFYNESKKLNEKVLKSKGKISAGTLINSTNRAANKLIKNFDLILNKGHTIISSKYDKKSPNYNTVKDLFLVLRKYIMLHDAEFVRDNDIPSDNDV